MVICVPDGPEVGEITVRLGICVTVNGIALLATPPTFITTLPEVAVAGTGTVIRVLLQLVGVAGVPLNVTALVPWVAPKLLPLMFIDKPTPPDILERLEIPGPGVTMKFIPLLATPPTVTTTLPLVAEFGTRATIEDALQFVTEAAVPLNTTMLELCDEPKLLPVIVTGEAVGPDVGERIDIAGVEPTVKDKLLLETAPTLTTTLPVVAVAGTGTTIVVSFQLVGVPVVPLNVTVLVP